MLDESGTFVHTQHYNTSLDLNLEPHKRRTRALYYVLPHQLRVPIVFKISVIFIKINKLRRFEIITIIGSIIKVVS